MTPTMNRRMNPLEWVMLLCLSVLWGGSFFFTEIAIEELPPLTVALLRVGLAAVILNVVTRAMGLRLPADGRIWIAFGGAGLLNNAVPFSLIAWGQSHIAGGLAAILNATAPLWTVVVAHFLTADEKMTGSRLCGVLIGFLGVVVMLGPEALTGLATDLLAQLTVLAAALSYAFAGVFGRRFKRMGVAPILAATGQVTASTMMLLPAAVLVDQPWDLSLPSLHTWGALFGIAALSTALAYVLYFRLLETAGATNLLLVTFLIPVSAMVLGTTLLAERLDPSIFPGMALIGLGLAAIDGRLLRFRPRAKARARSRCDAPEPALWSRVEMREPGPVESHTEGMRPASRRSGGNFADEAAARFCETASRPPGSRPPPTPWSWCRSYRRPCF
jgi:drug/metabolite transporter (DMT)-like permease